MTKNTPRDAITALQKLNEVFQRTINDDAVNGQTEVLGNLTQREVAYLLNLVCAEVQPVLEPAPTNSLN